MSERLRIRQEFMARLQAERQRRAAMQRADRSQQPVGLRGRDPYTRSHQPLPKFQGGHVFSGVEELTKRFGEHYAGKFRNWATGGKNPMRPGDPVLSMIAGGGPPGGTYNVPPGGFYGEPGGQAEGGEKDMMQQMVPLTMPGKRPPSPPLPTMVRSMLEDPSHFTVDDRRLGPTDRIIPTRGEIGDVKKNVRDAKQLWWEKTKRTFPGAGKPTAWKGMYRAKEIDRYWADKLKNVGPKEWGRMYQDAFLRKLRKGGPLPAAGFPRELQIRDMFHGPNLPGEIPKKGFPYEGQGRGFPYEGRRGRVTSFLRSEQERKWMNELRQKIKGIYPPGKSPMENMESIKAPEPSKMRKIAGAIKSGLGKGAKGIRKVGPGALQLLFLSQMGKSRGPDPYRGQRESAQKYGQPWGGSW